MFLLTEAMDWLLKRLGTIEKRLAQRHLDEGALVLYDVTSSYYEGKTCPLARFGYDRDDKTGCPITPRELSMESFKFHMGIRNPNPLDKVDFVPPTR